MGTEVTYTAHFCGVHPESFEDKLQGLEGTIHNIRELIINWPRTSDSKRSGEFTEILDEYEEAVRLQGYIWQAQDADDVEVSL